MKNRQIDNKTKQVRISKKLHMSLKLFAFQSEKTMKTIVEEMLKSCGIVEE